ncbi:MAG: aldo/keto reductase [Candidatus Omnitrophica bacterium]|nr:aldo/keto reductase [Candidatus Omnitrophota bacterium]MCM8801712.1 aldo/keto reductase [Candidatus Omnitrophota bacterium]
MLYRKFGKTGKYVSILGFGAMRLPTKEINGVRTIDEELSIKIIRRGFELGINYIDTAYGYCEQKSEIIVGRAIKGWRNKIYLSTKSPLWQIEKKDDYRRILEEQLKKLDVDYIDFYHFHSLNWQSFQEKVLKLDLIDEALKAKEEGIIKHISFSFHDKPEYMKKIIEQVDIFETILCQYNILDRSNEESIEYVSKKGIGVAVMGPVGGGRLSDFPYLMNIFKKKYRNPVEIAFKFVFANKNVSIALSGMNSLEMVEENVKIASSEKFLNEEEIKVIENIIKERKKLGEIPCTSCRYCLPCPQNIPIPYIFQLYNQYILLGSKKYKENYIKIGTEGKEERKKADACVECGQCEEKCPQKIEIRKELKKIHKILSS